MLGRHAFLSWSWSDRSSSLPLPEKQSQHQYHRCNCYSRANRDGHVVGLRTLRGRRRNWSSSHVHQSTVHVRRGGMEGAVVRVESRLVECVAETLPWVKLSTVEKGSASLGGICPGAGCYGVSVASVGSVRPHYGCACSDVDVKRLEGVVYYGNGVARGGATNCRKRGGEYWKNAKTDSDKQEDNLVRLDSPKRWMRPFEGAASTVTLVSA